MKTISIIFLIGALFFGFTFTWTPSNELTWETNFLESVKKAKKGKKKLLVNFTGSDWCGWCMKLDKEVFKQKEFIEYANKNLVCVKLDFPKRKKISDEEKAQNMALLQKYQVKGFPTIYILDTDENIVLRTGYQSGGAESYIEHLEQAIKAKK